ncbi:response regulator [Nibricoccus sp. IMCC34717]|uniref:response regulator n=1 Tax=Nibricoccus sp. IMCC34717 TaxID=3034021 RepID=UPI00384C7AE7
MKKILVVDDFAGVRLFHASLLRGAGYDTSAVGSGEEALRALERETFDLLVLDLIMPGLGGHEVLRQVRHHKTLARLPVIVITSETGAVTADALTLALVKPVLPKQLVGAAQAFLNEKEAHAVA